MITRIPKSYLRQTANARWCWNSEPSEPSSQTNGLADSAQHPSESNSEFDCGNSVESVESELPRQASLRSDSESLSLLHPFLFSCHHCLVHRVAEMQCSSASLAPERLYAIESTKQAIIPYKLTAHGPP